MRDGSWDNLIYLNGATNSIPRLAFFCAWNTFTTGGFTVTNVNAITDNLHPTELMTHPLVVTRDEVNWRYELPLRMNGSLTGSIIRLDWQGGALQRSADLVNWSDIAGAPTPFVESTATNSGGFFRLQRRR